MSTPSTTHPGRGTLAQPEPSSPEPPTAADRRAEALRRAARSKTQTATNRAETAIRDLVKNHDEITFRAVARAGGVSLDFLYANPELRQRIKTLRAQQTTRPAADPTTANPADDTVVHVLTGKLREERAARRDAVNDLQEQLTAAHGELLRLRRLLQQHGIHP